MFPQTRFTRFKIVSLFSILILFSSNTFSQSSTTSYLYWQPSAKYYSMGGIGTTISNDIYSAYYNPAALVFFKKDDYNRIIC